MPTLLIVDLLAERKAFGEKGVEEIINHFPNHEVLLWAPHTDEPRDYGFGIRIQEPAQADVIVITGSRRNVSMWEPWMDDVANLIRQSEVPIYGICFGHQIICKALGGEVVRAESDSKFIAEVKYSNGTSSMQLFTHQDHVIDAGEMNVVGSSEHCRIAVCEHPTRPIRTVQFHPEAVKSLLEFSVECGDMTIEERSVFGNGEQDYNVTDSLILPKY
jgi:GMP synthase-like glutamine amidotransferase